MPLLEWRQSKQKLAVCASRWPFVARISKAEKGIRGGQASKMGGKISKLRVQRHSPKNQMPSISAGRGTAGGGNGGGVSSTGGIKTGGIMTGGPMTGGPMVGGVMRGGAIGVTTDGGGGLIFGGLGGGESTGDGLSVGLGVTVGLGEVDPPFPLLGEGLTFLGGGL